MLKSPLIHGSEPQLTLVLALLKVVLGADFGNWNCGKAVFHIRGFNVRGREYTESGAALTLDHNRLPSTILRDVDYQLAVVILCADPGRMYTCPAKHPSALEQDQAAERRSARRASANLTCTFKRTVSLGS